MIDRIGEGQWTVSHAPRGQAGGRRRPRRPMRQAASARDGVSIAWDAADVADFDEVDASAGAGGMMPDAQAIAARLTDLPRLALAAQARLGRTAVIRLIAVNAMNRV